MAGGGTFTLGNPGWLVPVALLMLAGVVLVLVGRRSAPAGPLALALKLAGLALLGLCLLEPGWTTRHAKPGANLFVVLADNSRGMTLRDRGASRSRGEVLEAAVSGEPAWLARLGETFQVRRYLFDA